MQKPWLKSYPENVPEEIDLDRYQSLVEIFDEIQNIQSSAIVSNEQLWYD